MTWNVISRRLLLRSSFRNSYQCYKWKSPRLIQCFHNESPHLSNMTPSTNDNVETNVEVSKEVIDVFQKILQLDVVELGLLRVIVNEKLGVVLTENDLRGGSGGGGGGEGGTLNKEENAVVEEEKTHFELKLTGFDAKSKIKVIKEIRSITGLGLKDAKEMVEGAPKIIQKNVKKEEAEELKAKLEAVGATVELE